MSCSLPVQSSLFHTAATWPPIFSSESKSPGESSKSPDTYCSQWHWTQVTPVRLVYCWHWVLWGLYWREQGNCPEKSDKRTNLTTATGRGTSILMWTAWVGTLQSWNAERVAMLLKAELAPSSSWGWLCLPNRGSISSDICWENRIASLGDLLLDSLNFVSNFLKKWEQRTHLLKLHFSFSTSH